MDVFPVSTNLLLSYTYFLNSNKSSSISIGFEPEDFSSRIVISSSKKHTSFRHNDWVHLYNNSHKIDSFFATNSTINIENHYGVIESKLKNKINRKKINFGLRKIALREDEWKELFFLVQVLKMSNFSNFLEGNFTK